jgi:adenylate kinase
MKYRAILMFGAPGAGKGTQGKILGQIPGFVHFSCGDAFRSLRMDSPLGHTFVDYASRGNLVPDEPTIELWHTSIQGMMATNRFHPSNDTMVLDGIPRNPRQAELLRDVIDVKAIFNLFCPVQDKLVARLQRRALKENRLDDANVEVIRARLETYKRETRAVLSCYPDTIIHLIDSTQEPMLVLLDILKILSRIPRPSLGETPPAAAPAASEPAVVPAAIPAS